MFEKIYRHDALIALFLVFMTAILITSLAVQPGFLQWAFERHQNTLSWYIRPLFLVPFCFAAYRHSLAGIALTLLALTSSMFWFPVPAIVDARVSQFLEMEKAWLTSGWGLGKTVLAATVPMTLFALGLALWKRSLAMGVAVMVLMATGKIAWSISAAGASGMAILVPALLGLAICTALVIVLVRRGRRK